MQLTPSVVPTWENHLEIERWVPFDRAYADNIMQRVECHCLEGSAVVDVVGLTKPTTHLHLSIWPDTSPSMDLYAACGTGTHPWADPAVNVVMQMRVLTGKDPLPARRRASTDEALFPVTLSEGGCRLTISCTASQLARFVPGSDWIVAIGWSAEPSF